mmetsp:Transcript_119534/g.334792  ORF Transcript_119534/g.334792 Transcript_119534/m.334792 type:complete len:296 (+) Transcript_119534:104-991(+)
MHPMQACGFAWTIFVKPTKAVVFSQSFRVQVMVSHQTCAKSPKALPAKGPLTTPSRPNVMQMFCIRSCCCGTHRCLCNTEINAWSTSSMNGAMYSSPTLTQISPMAQEALLLTVADVCSRKAVAQRGMISGRNGLNGSMQNLAQSPTSAKALCRTCNVVFLRTGGTTAMKFRSARTSAALPCRPSTMEAKRSRLAATTSRSGRSHSAGFCCHISAAWLPVITYCMHRSQILGMIGSKASPRLCVKWDKHSSNPSRVRLLPCTWSNFSIIGVTSAWTYFGWANSRPTALANVPLAS